MPAPRRSSQAVYQQIADDLRAEVIGGAIKPGGQLPTESALMKRYEVARATVRQALAQLVNEGLVLPIRPRGHFVRDRRPMRYRPQREFTAVGVDVFLSDHQDEGREPTQDIEVAIVEPPPLVAERLRSAPEELAVVRRRLRYLDNEPFNINDSYFPLDLVTDTEIMRPADIARGANQVLAEHGHPQTRAVDEIFVRMPTPEEAHRLDLGPGTPVACHVCTGLTDNDVPVRVVVNILPGDRHIITYERTRPEATAEPEP